MRTARDTPDSARPPLAVIAGVVVLLLGSATLFSGPGPAAGGAGPSAQRWGAVLAAIASALTLPLDTPGAADIRTLLLPALAGIVLAIWSVSHWRSASVRPIRVMLRRVISRDNWLEWLVLAVVGWSFYSATANQTLDYSRGWIVLLFAGGLWAAMLRHFVPAERVLTGIAWALCVAAAMCGLALWHRQHMMLRYFNWPIGPLTPTAAVASLAATTAVGLLLGVSGGETKSKVESRKSNDGEHAATAQQFEANPRWLTAIALGTAIIAGAVALIAGRRAPLLGSLAGSAAAVVLVLTRRGIPRRAWITLGLTGLGAMCALSMWYRSQAVSPAAEVSGPIALRWAYWQESLALIVESPVTGHGPDSFAQVMTPRLTHRRAEQPHVYHGNIDPHAHNEWLQAAVELGLPGAILYLLIPLGALTTAFRFIRRTHVPPSQFAAVSGLAAGLVCMVVSEAASTSLRGTILTPWYWTWIGLLLAASRDSNSAAGANAIQGERRSVNVTALLLLIPAVWILRLTLDECSRMIHHARGITALCRDPDPHTALSELQTANDRWGFEPWLAAHSDQATALDAIAQLALHPAGSAPSSPSKEIPQAVEAATVEWRQLADRFPALGGFEVRLAESLLRSSQRDAAKIVLSTWLSRDPFDPRANLALIDAIVTDPWQRLMLATNALRGGPASADIQRVLTGAFDTPGISARWQRLFGNDTQTRGAEEATYEFWGMAEYWRADAQRRGHAGDRPGAIDMLRRAAEEYRRLYEIGSPYRRRFEAEWDAWYVLAEMTWSADHGDFARAFDAVRQAERFAVLGYPHEALRHADASAEFLGGQVALTETPDVLRPLWRLTAKLRLALGLVDRHLLYRIALSLPAESQTMDGVQRELQRLTDEVVRDFEIVPADRRPARYDELQRRAER